MKRKWLETHLNSKKTIREYLTDIQKTYEEVKQIIYEVFQKPLTLIMNLIQDTLNGILDLPYSEENFKLLKDFLNSKFK